MNRPPNRQARRAADARAGGERIPSILMLTAGHTYDPETRHEKCVQQSLLEIPRIGWDRISGSWLPAVRDSIVHIFRSSPAVKAFDVLLMLDSDQTWTPLQAIEVALQARRHGFVGGLYGYRGTRKLVATFAEPRTVVNGRDGQPMLAEVHTMGAGFLACDRDALEMVARKQPEYRNGDDPNVYRSMFSPIPPGWVPTVVRVENVETVILARQDSVGAMEGEDAAFCRRVRECGYKVYAHLGIFVGHLSKPEPFYPRVCDEGREVGSDGGFAVDVMADGGSKAPMTFERIEEAHEETRPE